MAQVCSRIAAFPWQIHWRQLARRQARWKPDGAGPAERRAQLPLQKRGRRPVWLTPHHSQLLSDEMLSALGQRPFLSQGTSCGKKLGLSQRLLLSRLRQCRRGDRNLHRCCTQPVGHKLANGRSRRGGRLIRDPHPEATVSCWEGYKASPTGQVTDAGLVATFLPHGPPLWPACPALRQSWTWKAFVRLVQALFKQSGKACFDTHYPSYLTRSSVEWDRHCYKLNTYAKVLCRSRS